MKQILLITTLLVFAACGGPMPGCDGGIGGTGAPVAQTCEDEEE